MTPQPDRDDLDALAAHLRSHPQLRNKGRIELVSEVLGGTSWVHGPGDDGAVIELPRVSAPSRLSNADQEGHVIACGEAMLPAFISADPHGAGFSAVLANVNDLAAMGAVPLGIVDTVVGTAALAREALRGMKAAAEMYAVPLVGGHLTVHDGPPALSAFGIGHASSVLSTTHVAAGQSLIVAGCTTGRMRPDFGYFRSYDDRVEQMAGDIRVPASIAAGGACVAAKDVSMAGLVGSLAMLLEWSRLGVILDLDLLPRPTGVPLRAWLTCFPAYVFLLCAVAGREQEVLQPFQARGLSAAVVGTVDDSGLLQIASGGRHAKVLDLSVTPITGLHH